MAQNRGRLVVLEGIDGAGTTTHVARLAEKLRTVRVPVRVTREPSDGPVGTLVRQVLTGRLVAPGELGGPVGVADAVKPGLQGAKQGVIVQPMGLAVAELLEGRPQPRFSPGAEPGVDRFQ